MNKNAVHFIRPPGWNITKRGYINKIGERLKQILKLLIIFIFCIADERTWQFTPKMDVHL